MIQPGSARAIAREIFDQLVEEYECYEGQICISTVTFRRTIQKPIMNLLKKLEKEGVE